MCHMGIALLHSMPVKLQPHEICLLSDFSATNKNICSNEQSTIMCLNRHYACENGYNFIAPHSSFLSIYQSELVPGYKTREDFEDFASSICANSINDLVRVIKNKYIFSFI